MLWQPYNLTATCPPHTELTTCSNFALVYLNLLVRLYGDSEDRRVQEKYNIQEKEEDRQQYDFIVIGAGAAGAIVANRLTEVEEWKVLLLEAGGEQPDVTLVPALSTALLDSNIDWQYKTQPDGKSCLGLEGQQCAWPRGKMMGGSSSINSMAYIRGNKLDYDTWAAMGNKGWSYKDVLPYFKKSEKNLNIESLNRKYHGVDGEQPVSRYPFVDQPSIMLTNAFHERGLPLADYNGAFQRATMQAQAFSQDGERVSTNNAFIQPIRYKRKNLTVKVNAEVFKILISKKKVAYGVKYNKDGKVYTAYAKKEVILSGGTINTPKLLMLSGVGPKQHLKELNIPVKKDLAVGENLHDHVTFNGIIIFNISDTVVSQEEMLDEIKEYKKMDIKHGPLSGNGPVNSIAFIKTDENLPAPDIQYQVNKAYLHNIVTNLALNDATDKYPTAYYDAVVPRTMNLVPKSRGKLLLNPKDPHGDPLIYANYFGNHADFIPLIKGVKYLISLENTPAFKQAGAYFYKKPLEPCQNYQWGSDEYIVCLAKQYTSSPYHPVGTCKMGPKSDEKAVVDLQLRVYGISGLRVIDASIMPVVIRGNTNAPSMMIGEKGVDMVKKYWLNKTCDSC